MFASLSEAQIYGFLFFFLQILGYKRVSTFKLGSIILLEQNSCNIRICFGIFSQVQPTASICKQPVHH